jgi:hypothetical protein
MSPTHRAISRTRIIGLLTLLPLLWSGFVRAQAADPSASEDDTTPAPKPAQAPAQESPPPQKANESVEPAPLGPFERLPPSAYPEWKTRGLYGGSLWSSNNMHGMPWPYYPKTGIGVSGYAWIDTGYESIVRGNNSEPNYKYLVSQGRALLRVTPTYSPGTWYAQAQTEFVGNKDQSVSQPDVVDIDDLWIRIGKWRSWDVQMGRFEAFEVYHFGMGMDLNTLERQGATDLVRPAPDVFELGGNSNIVYRQSGITNLAFHLYPTDFLRFELLGQFGFDTASAIDTLGARPAVVFDVGWLKIKAAGDARKQFPVANSSKESRWVRGGAGAVQLVLDPIVELGVNVAYGKVDHYSPTNSTDPNATMGDHDTAGSVTDLDVGAFANLRLFEGLLVGGGANYDQETDQQSGRFTHLQAFGALQYLFSKQVFVKVVGAYARAHIAQGGVPPWDDTMESVRVRLICLF